MAHPHYLRFARSLALVSGLGCAAAGCGLATTPSGDAGGSATDTGGGATDTGTVVADAGTDAGNDTGADAGFDCTTCTCGLTADDAGVPFCSGDAIILCNCAAVGPLSPPDLPA